MMTKKILSIVLIIVLSVATLYGALVLFVSYYSKQITLENFGVFGDSFGFVNAIFSGLAFCGLIFTILMQREELELQRKELRLTREEFAAQSAEFKIQNETLKRQRFESTFFQMLALHNEIVKQMEVRLGSVSNSGRDAFKSIFFAFKTDYAEAIKEVGLLEVNKIYLGFYGKIRQDVGHYFGNLYNIVKFIHNSDIEDKRLYTNIVRAQLSSYELYLIFYNCLSDNGREKFKPLVEAYALMKNLPDKLVPESHLHRRFYDVSAFGVSHMTNVVN